MADAGAGPTGGGRHRRARGAVGTVAAGWGHPERASGTAGGDGLDPRRAELLRLQRSAGNGAVARAVALQRDTGPADRDPADRDPAGPDQAGKDPAGTETAGTNTAGAETAGADPAVAGAAGAGTVGAGLGFRAPSIFGDQFRLRVDPLLDPRLDPRFGALLRTPLPRLAADQALSLDPVWLRDLLGRIRSPLDPASMYAVLRSLPAPLAPVLPAVPLGPAAAEPEAAVPVVPAGTQDQRESDAQLAAPAEQRRQELVKRLTEAVSALVKARFAGNELVPAVTDALAAGVLKAAAGGQAEDVVGAAAGKLASAAVDKLVPPLTKALLDWFHRRSTTERLLITLPPAAVIGFGSIFGGVALGRAARDDTTRWRTIRDTGLEALGGARIQVPALDWLSVEFKVTSHQGGVSDPGYRPAALTGGALTVDFAKLIPALR